MIWSYYSRFLDGMFVGGLITRVVMDLLFAWLIWRWLRAVLPPALPTESTRKKR